MLSHLKLIIGLDLFVAALDTATLKQLHEAFSVLVRSHGEFYLVLREGEA